MILCKPNQSEGLGLVISGLCIIFNESSIPGKVHCFQCRISLQHEGRYLFGGKSRHVTNNTVPEN